MSTAIAPTSSELAQIHASRPSFIGLVRSELFRTFHRIITWVLLVATFVMSSAYYVALFSLSDLKDRISHDHLQFLYNTMTQSLGLFRAFSGIFLLVLVAYVIGLEYQQGTIRIILGRGVGRLQLLFAKLTAVVLLALALFVVGVLYNLLLTVLVLSTKAGNIDLLTTAPAAFWSNIGTFLLTILLNMGVTILLATAITTIFRSLSLGLTASVLWFPIDNIASIMARLLHSLTGQQFWFDATAYLLGPNLNDMASVILPKQLAVYPVVIAPMVDVDGNHTLWVAAIYSAIFLIVALVLTWKRDVKE